MSALFLNQAFSLRDGAIQWNRALNSVREELLNGDSVLWILPQERFAARAELWRDIRSGTGTFGRVHLDAIDVSGGRERGFGRELGLVWPSDEHIHVFDPLKTLQENEALPKIIWCDGWDKLTLAEVENWLYWIARWAHMAKDRDFAPALCAPLPWEALTAFPQEPDFDNGGPKLQKHWWWGQGSQLDLRVWCRNRSEVEADIAQGETHTSASARQRWREHVLPALCLDDQSLAASLWDTVCGTISDIEATLENFACERTWDANNLQEWGWNDTRGNHTYFTRHPPQGLEKLWNQGIARWTPELGVEMHSAALNIGGRPEEVWHRFWRGQAGLLLPFLDFLRLEICRFLIFRHGEGWALWMYPADERHIAALQNIALTAALYEVLHRGDGPRVVRVSA